MLLFLSNICPLILNLLHSTPLPSLLYISTFDRTRKSICFFTPSRWPTAPRMYSTAATSIPYDDNRLLISSLVFFFLLFKHHIPSPSLPRPSPPLTLLSGTNKLENSDLASSSSINIGTSLYNSLSSTTSISIFRLFLIRSISLPLSLPPPSLSLSF